MKRTLTAVAAASMVLGTFVPMALASTSSNGYTNVGTKPFVVNGKTLSNPYVLDANDSGNTTAFIGMYYFDQALQALGFTGTWNGTTHTWEITAPGVDASKISISGGIGTGNTAISVNGTVIKKINTFAAKDPAGSSVTTYFPAFYVNELFTAVNMKASWSGSNGLALAPAASIKLAGANSSVAEGMNDAFTLTNNGTAVTSGATYSVSGSGAMIDQNGNFIASAPGTYTVTASYEGQTATASVTVYAQASAVKLSTTSSSIVANGQATNVVTATVVDANGNTVANFNGTANITDNNSGASAAVTLPSPATVTFTNGVGTFTATATSNTGKTDTLSINSLVSTNGQGIASGVNYGTIQISSVAQGATALGLKAATPTLSDNANSNYVPVTLSINDSTGTALAAPSSQYVTVTITGPGSLTSVPIGGTATTSETFYTTGQTINVYPIQGQSGTITVTATAAGLTTATAAINAVSTGQASKIAVTSSQGTLTSAIGGFAKGTAFTMYTVQLEDASGNAVVPGSTDNLTISDNSQSATPAGTLAYYSVTTGQPSGAAWTAVGGNYTQALGSSTGQLEFAVMNSTVGGANPTITIKDSLTGTSQTATYNYATGSASQVVLANHALSAFNVQAGNTATVTVQLEDAAGNTLSTSGQNVSFYFGSNAAGATIANSTGWTSSNAYTVSTNSQGQASVTVSVPSAATAGQTFTVDAFYGTQTPISVGTGTVTSAATYAATIALGNASVAPSSTPTSGQLVTWPSIAIGANTTVQTATGAASMYVFPENSIGQVANTTDTIEVTTSNPNVVSIGTGGGWTQIGTGTVTSVEGAASSILPSITGMQVGTATITFTDISNPSAPTLTESVSVNSGAAQSAAAVEYNGEALSSTNSLGVTANTPVAVTIVNVDGGGNPVVVTGSTPKTVTLNDTNGGQYRLTANGANITEAQIPAGQSSTTVYYVNPTTQTITGGLTTAAAVATSMTITPAATSIAAGTAQNYVVKVLDQNGNVDLGYTGTVTLSSSDALAVLPGAYTFTSSDAGMHTFSVTLNTAGTQTVTAGDGTLSITSGNITVS